MIKLDGGKGSSYNNTYQIILVENVMMFMMLWQKVLQSREKEQIPVKQNEKI